MAVESNFVLLDEEKVLSIRKDFPILDQQIHGNPLIYLDNAATTQMPHQVIDAISEHYLTNNANVHRGIHTLSERSTSAFEHARETVSSFIGAPASCSVVFTGGSTDSVNMVARMVEPMLNPEDAILVSALEHHANLVTWQQLCKRVGCRMRIVSLDEQGDIDLAVLERLLEAEKVKLFAFAQVSNVLGTVSPAKTICDICHSKNALVIMDAAQSIRHELVDVSRIDCDFMFFSGHKMLGPTGIGVLYIKDKLLSSLQPVAFGGEMVDRVSFEESTFECAPIRFEAGTPNYVGAIALARAIDYLESIGRQAINAYERSLIKRAEQNLRSLEGVTILGNPHERAGCISFVADGVHPFDLALFVDKKGVALRSGTQCAQPLLKQVYEVEKVCRLSPAFYNTLDEIERCAEVLEETLSLLRKFNR